MLATHLHLVQRLGMSGSMPQTPPPPHVPSCRGQEKLLPIILHLGNKSYKAYRQRTAHIPRPYMEPHAPSGRSPKSQTYRSLHQDVVAEESHVPNEASNPERPHRVQSVYLLWNSN
jgi:hypothetical protein